MSGEHTHRTRYCSRCLTTFDGDPEACPNLSCRSRRKREGWGELLRDGDVLDRHYHIDRCLAIGGAGVTYLARELGDDDAPAGPPLAIKVLYTHRDHGPYLKRLATEAQILQELEHPNIVKMMGFVNRAGRSPYLLTRFEPGGSLLDHLRRVGAMSVRTVAGMGVQLCEALELAHGKGVIHRDLKPENILLAREAAPGEVPLARLTDFGIAKVASGIGERLTRMGAFVGTPQYAAPEQFAGREPTAATDLFSLAAVLWFCITLEPLTPPDLIMDPAEALLRLDQRLPVTVDEGGTPDEVASFNRFLAATTQPAPERRCTVAHARAMLQAILLGDPVPEPPDRAPDTLAPSTMPLSMDEVRSLTADPSTAELPPPSGDEAPTTLSRDPAGAEQPTTRADARDEPVVLPEGTRSNPGGWTAPPLLPPLERPKPPPPPAPKPRSGLVLVAGLGAFLGVIGLGGLTLAWALAPSKLPASLRGALPAQVLTASSPEHAEHAAALAAHLDRLAPALRQSCGLSPDAPVVLDLTIEPTGRLRTLRASGLDEAQRACVASALEDEVFPRAGLMPVRLALSL